jgi:hypothetical protein
MKPRSKTLLVAAALTLMVGVCGAWPLLRTQCLQARLLRLQTQMHARGIRMEVGNFHWEGLWTAKLDALIGLDAHETAFELRGITILFRPAASLSGSEWVKRVDINQISLNTGGIQAAGKGWFVPSTYAAGWDGKWHISGPNVHKLNASGHLRLIAAGQTWQQGQRRNAFGFDLTDLQASHPALSDSALKMKPMSGWLRSEFGKAQMAIRRGSWLRCGQMPLWASGHWDRVQNTLRCNANLPKVALQVALEPVIALAPQWLQGIQASGTVKGNFAFDVDLDSLPTLKIDGRLESHQTKVSQWGAANLNTLHKIADSPGFLPLSELPDYLVQAVLLSEDAGFWEHKGFDREIIRLAMIENIAERRFVRGAGTIPMQLVRNIYLHHGKQFDRKIAEVTLTWLAQDQQILTKEQELTCYLNLIEWGENGVSNGKGVGGLGENGVSNGKGVREGALGNVAANSVFGIGAACRLYFGKVPQQITVDEAIFLACVIPNPRHAGALLMPDGSLTEYAQAYFDTMRWMLYEGDWIDEKWLDAPYPIFRSIAV